MRTRALKDRKAFPSTVRTAKLANRPRTADCVCVAASSLRAGRAFIALRRGLRLRRCVVARSWARLYCDCPAGWGIATAEAEAAAYVSVATLTFAGPRAPLRARESPAQGRPPNPPRRDLSGRPLEHCPWHTRSTGTGPAAPAAPPPLGGRWAGPGSDSCAHPSAQSGVPGLTPIKFLERPAPRTASWSTAVFTACSRLDIGHPPNLWTPVLRLA